MLVVSIFDMWMACSVLWNMVSMCERQVKIVGGWFEEGLENDSEEGYSSSSSRGFELGDGASELLKSPATGLLMAANLYYAFRLWSKRVSDFFCSCLVISVFLCC